MSHLHAVPEPPRGESGIEAALVAGRRAAAVLEAAPANLFAGYNGDEVAAQYAATDQLLKAFHDLDGLLSSVS